MSGLKLTAVYITTVVLGLTVNALRMRPTIRQ
jgi:hypothetical protein